MGPQFVVVKKGEHGAVLVHRDGVAVLPAFPADAKHVIDPTGAGDSFAGGMMAHIAATGSGELEVVQEGLSWGTVMASFTIEAFGLDRLAKLDRAQIDTRMQQFRKAAKVG